MVKAGENLKIKTLELLRLHQPEFISGEEICRKIGISRTAVWKHVAALREEGYVIEAIPRSGYRLTEIPDRMYVQEIKNGLLTDTIGKDIFYFDSIQSTNVQARKLASEGALHGTVVMADEQTKGKGRLGRSWFSPKGTGIWCTLVLRPEIVPGEASPVTMLTAVAVAEAVEKIADVSLDIKWPNDLLHEGKKVCGILTEMNAEMDKINYLLVGIGININSDSMDFPFELRETTASLSSVKKNKISRLKLLRQLLLDFEYYYQLWLDYGFKPVLEEWKKRCPSLKSPVKISTADKVWEGWFEDVDDEGALILRLNNGELQRFVSGEVTLREN